MKNRIELDRAIASLGGQSELSRRLGATRTLVNSWLTRGFPVRRCVAIERDTGGVLNRQLMRPDDWQAHWPELATGHPARQRASGINTETKSDTDKASALRRASI